MNTNLTLLALLLKVAGSLGALLGEIWLLAVLFRRGRVWVIGLMVLPQLLPVCIALHPRRSARPLLVSLVGLLLHYLGISLLPPTLLP